MKDLNKENIETWSQPSEGGTLYIPKSLKEVGERAKRDAERLMKLFSVEKDK